MPALVSPNDRRRAEIIALEVSPLSMRIGGRDDVVRYTADRISNRALNGRMDAATFSTAEALALATEVVDALDDLAGLTDDVVRQMAGERAEAVAAHVERASEAMEAKKPEAALRELRAAMAIDPDGAGPRRGSVAGAAAALAGVLDRAAGA